MVVLERGNEGSQIGLRVEALTDPGLRAGVRLCLILRPGAWSSPGKRLTCQASVPGFHITSLSGLLRGANINNP